MLFALAIAARIVRATWVGAAIALRLGSRSTGLRWVFGELRPFYWPLALAEGALRWAAEGEVSPRIALLAAVDVVLWWRLRNAGGGDDRWRKRLDALGQRVVRSVHRLRVVPAGAGA